MSVIQEALKKAEKKSPVTASRREASLQPSAPEKKTSEPPVSVIVPALPSSRKKLPIIAMILTALVIAAGSGLFFLRHLHGDLGQAQGPAPTTAAVPLLRAGLEPAPTETLSHVSGQAQGPAPTTAVAPLFRAPTRPAPTFKNFKEPVLSGIMYSGDKSLAVINDCMLKEGDSIDNVKVVKINEKSVDIEMQDGRVANLKLTR